MKMKKIFSAILALTMAFSLAACGGEAKDKATEKPAATENQAAETEKTDTANAETTTETTEPTPEPEPEKQLPPMTTEPITLRYASWMQKELVDYMSAEFMKKYPNITVEIVELTGGIPWTENLLNLSSAGNLPDAYWLQDIDAPIRNGLLGNMTEYYENDPDVPLLYDTIQKTGYFNTDKALAMPILYRPDVIYLNKTLFDKYNVPLPDPNWKYSDMIALMKTMTRPDDKIFGYFAYTLLTTMLPIVDNDAVGEFGWDGKEFHLEKGWPQAITQHAEYIRTGVHAPRANDAAEIAYGNRDMWPPSSGQVAMSIDMWWAMNYYTSQEFIDKGVEWVPFPVPFGDNNSSGHIPSYVDLGTISPVSEHPREAYELLKFMTWDKEGWLLKIEAAKTLNTVAYEEGDKSEPYLISRDRAVGNYYDALPLINDDEVWAAYKTIGAFENLNPYLDNVYKRATHPAPRSANAIPGFVTFIHEYLWDGPYGDVEPLIEAGELDAYDIVEELNGRLNEVYTDTMVELGLNTAE